MSTDPVPVRTRLGLRIERVWILKDASGQLIASEKRPADRSAVEYMRVMTRQEVEKQASDGVDTQQLLNSLIRTNEGQRIEINRLQQEIADLHETPEL